VGEKPSLKNVFTSTRLLLVLIAILPIVLSLGILLTYRTSLFKLFPGIEEETVPIMLGEDTFETLIVKTYYPSEIAGIMGNRIRSEASGNRVTVIIGELLKVEWREEAVGISMINDSGHVFSMKDLRKGAEQLKLYFNDSPVEAMISVLNLSYPRLRNPPEKFKNKAIRILENQSFIKWLKEEGFAYVVESIRITGALGGWSMVWTSYAEIELLVEGIEASCTVIFNETYRIESNANAFKELRVSLEENNKTNGICVYIYKYGEAYVVGTIVGSKNPYDPGYTYSMDEACLKNSSNVWVSPAVFARVSVINTTSELGQRIMQILGSNRLTARLIESGCKVNLMMAEYSFDEADRCFNAHLYHGEKEIVLDLRINPDSGRIEKISFNAPE
jgi:hypothetical protein